MSSNPNRLYWDCNTWLDWLTGEAPNKTTLDSIYAAWKGGDVTMVTSALTIAQIYFVRVGTPRRVDRSRDADVDALFDPPPDQPLVLVELSRTTAKAARALSRQHSVSWDDAIHIASAIEARCELMHTGDDALWDKSGRVGGDPVLRIEAPSWVMQDVVVDASTIDPGRFTNLVDPSELERPSGRSPGDAQASDVEP